MTSAGIGDYPCVLTFFIMIPIDCKIAKTYNIILLPSLNSKVLEVVSSYQVIHQHNLLIQMQ